MPAGFRVEDFDPSLYQRYTVQSGDTLSAIAKRLHVDASEIRRPDGSRVEDTDRDVIFTRESLYVPKIQRPTGPQDGMTPPTTTAPIRPPATGPKGIRVTLGRRPGADTPATFAVAHDVLRQLVKSGSEDKSGVALGRLFNAFLPVGAAARVHVRFATLAHFADAAAHTGYPLTQAGIDRLKSDAGITDEDGVGPKTAAALAAAIEAKGTSQTIAVQAGDWVPLQFPTSVPPPEIVRTDRKDLPAVDRRTRELLAPATLAKVDTSTYDALIAEGAALNGLDPALVKAIICRESNFKRTAISPVGAQGLMQLMEGTGLAMGIPGDRYNARDNVLAGCRFLRFLADKFNGDVVKIVAAYNAGPNAVSQALKSYSETRNYVQDVLIYYRHYQATMQPALPGTVAV